MIEFPLEQILAGAAQTAEAPRVRSSAPDVAAFGGAFARVMNAVKVQQDQAKKDPEDKPPPRRLL